MTTLILSILVLGTVILAMSVGVLFGRKPIKGSCGGMSAIGMKTSCDICGGDTQACENERASVDKKQSAKTSKLAYDASKPL